MSDIPARPVLPGEDTKSVSLREFEQRLEKLEQQFSADLKHERDLREEITARHEEARKLNANEIMRRLEELNHAHKLAAENWARSLPREMFEQWRHEYDKTSQDVGTQLTKLAPCTTQISAIMSKLEIIEKDVNLLKTVGSSHAQSLDVRVKALETQNLGFTSTPTDLSAVDARVAVMERLVQKLTGVGILLGLMGLSGVLALILGLVRLAKGVSP